MTSGWIVAVGLALVGAAPNLVAQRTLAPGSKVRVTAPRIVEKPVVGVLSAVDSASLSVQLAKGDSSTSLTIPLADVTRLQLYGGRSHSPLKGMGTGVLVGAAGAGLIVGVLAATSEDAALVCDPAYCIVGSTLGGASWGTVIGGLIGTAVGSARWDTVVLQPRLSLAPHGAGVSMAVTLRF